MGKCDNIETRRVSTPDGLFTGVDTGCGTVQFLGITYARYRRFCPPEIVDYPESPAEGCVEAGPNACAEADGKVRTGYDATSYGCVCPQDLTHLKELLGEDSVPGMEEGRLCLSVTVPSEAREAALPVMVWIHGGSYLTGGSEDGRYDVSEIALAGNVVVVKISYRLGAFGYLRRPQMEAGNVENAPRMLERRGDAGCGTANPGLESQCDAGRGTANPGLEDQKTALKWIQRHISSFGGDPGNVTLWGQSAGAHSIASLIASADSLQCATNVPLFGGQALFHKAILQSPPLGIRMSPRDAERLCALFLHRLARRMEKSPVESDRTAAQAKAGGKKADETERMWRIAETAPVEDLIAVQTSMKKMHFALPFMPVLPDCTSFPRMSSGEKQGCPRCRPEAAGTPFRVLLYCNRDDASVYARKILGRTLYRTPLGSLFTRIITAAVFEAPAEKYLRKMRKSGVEAALCRFSWHPAGSVLGCCHSIELPFLLGHQEDWSRAEMLQGMTEAEYRHYSTVFKTLWTEFARSGKFPAAGEI